jgi:predicted transcriptional regulator
MAAVFKQEAHQLVDRLPDSATWDDLIECARFQKAIEEGAAALDRGEFASDEEVRRVFAKWSKDAETDLGKLDPA